MRIEEVDRNGNSPQFEVVTRMSEMPCRLIDGLHEWRNEFSTVPTYDPPNIRFWCTRQRGPVGSEDPVKLYCSLLL